MSEWSANDRSPIKVDGDAEWAALIALAGLPKLTPSRFWSLIEAGSPPPVWKRVAAGGAPTTGATAIRQLPGQHGVVTSTPRLN
jgi:hypothetical protein